MQNIEKPHFEKADMVSGHTHDEHLKHPAMEDGSIDACCRENI